MKILSIETSCDESAVAVLEFKKRDDHISVKVLGQELHSQVDMHREYGGVFPTIAKREHQKILPILTERLLRSLNLLDESETKNPFFKGFFDKNFDNLFKDILEKNKILYNVTKKLFDKKKITGIDYIAVTNGPGLAPALYVGVNFAKMLSYFSSYFNFNRIKVIPVNHLEGHIFSSFLSKDKLTLEKQKYPFLALLVSGGHTELVLSKGVNEYQKLGETLDDAAGEAFDKVARLLDLGFPGGPEISKQANFARKNNLKLEKSFPRPILKENNLNFSYSGLKTAVRVYVEKNPPTSIEDKAKIAREFEDVIIETLIEKTRKAIEKYNPVLVTLGGGVAANTFLRDNLKALVKKYSDENKKNISLLIPEQELSTDNAVMIAVSAFFNQKKATNDLKNLQAYSNLSIDSSK